MTELDPRLHELYCEVGEHMFTTLKSIRLPRCYICKRAMCPDHRGNPDVSAGSWIGCYDHRKEISALNAEILERARARIQQRAEDGPEYLPGVVLVVKFLPGDEEEAKAWAREHANRDWAIRKSPNDTIYTLVFTHKEGDTAPFPFTYIWDGEKIVKKDVTQESGE